MINIRELSSIEILLVCIICSIGIYFILKKLFHVEAKESLIKVYGINSIVFANDYMMKFFDEEDK